MTTRRRDYFFVGVFFGVFFFALFSKTVELRGRGGRVSK
jgi:hypothetical protein